MHPIDSENFNGSVLGSVPVAIGNKIYLWEYTWSFLQLLPLCKETIVTSGDNLGPIQSCSDCKTNECSSLAAEVKADGVVGFLSFWPNWPPLSFPAPEKNLDIYSIISVIILSSKAFQHAYENSETKSRFNDKQSPTEIRKIFFISRSPLFDKIVCSTAHSPFSGVPAQSRLTWLSKMSFAQ